MSIFFLSFWLFLCVVAQLPATTVLFVIAVTVKPVPPDIICPLQGVVLQHVMAFVTFV
jgi:hypothetical protein